MLVCGINLLRFMLPLVKYTGPAAYLTLQLQNLCGKNKYSAGKEAIHD